MDSHYQDEIIVQLSYLYNGNPYIGKITSLNEIVPRFWL